MKRKGVLVVSMVALFAACSCNFLSATMKPVNVDKKSLSSSVLLKPKVSLGELEDVKIGVFVVTPVDGFDYMSPDPLGMGFLMYQLRILGRDKGFGGANFVAELLSVFNEMFARQEEYEEEKGKEVEEEKGKEVEEEKGKEVEEEKGKEVEEEKLTDYSSCSSSSSSSSASPTGDYLVALQDMCGKITELLRVVSSGKERSRYFVQFFKTVEELDDENGVTDLGEDSFSRKEVFERLLFNTIGMKYAFIEELLDINGEPVVGIVDVVKILSVLESAALSDYDFKFFEKRVAFMKRRKQEGVVEVARVGKEKEEAVAVLTREKEELEQVRKEKEEAVAVLTREKEELEQVRKEKEEAITALEEKLEQVRKEKEEAVAVLTREKEELEQVRKEKEEAITALEEKLEQVGKEQGSEDVYDFSSGKKNNKSNKKK